MTRNKSAFFPETFDGMVSFADVAQGIEHHPFQRVETEVRVPSIRPNPSLPTCAGAARAFPGARRVYGRPVMAFGPPCHCSSE